MAIQRISLREYVRRRNGVPLGASGSMGNMLRRSFGSGTFGGFWRYWNPIFGYGLGRYVYSPLQKFIPAWGALVLTFVVCGMLHDLVSMMAGGKVAFLFTPWFFLLGCGVVLGDLVGADYSDRMFAIRVGVNLSYLSLCLVGALCIRTLVGL